MNHMKKGAGIAAVVAVLALAGGTAGYIFFGPSSGREIAEAGFQTITPLEGS
jgi:hypothetical protein